MMRSSTASILFSILLMVPATVQADAIGDKCRAAKNKAAGQFAGCLQKAEAGLVVRGDSVAFANAVAKCEEKFSKKFDAAEQKAADQSGACPTTGDQPQLQTAISGYSGCIAGALGGSPACLLCGNGVVDSGEDCDLGADGVGDCSSATAGSAPLGEVSCAPGCVYDTSNCRACDGGAVVGGFCWYLGADGQSCSSLCSTLGAVYSDGTKSFAGSGGSNDNCAAVLDALGVAPGVVQTLAMNGMGCWVNGSSRERDPMTTQPYTEWPGGRRACACR